jgi:hypothetical protein
MLVTSESGSRFKLVVRYRDGKTQTQNIDNLFKLVQRINAIRPAFVKSYEVALVLHTCTFPDPEPIR